MNNFTFHNPTKVIFGNDTIRKIGREIAARGLHRVLLLAGGGSIKNNGVYEQVTTSLREAGVSWAEYWGVRPNPVLEDVNAAIRQAREEKVDGLLAVGGGSVIDSTKAVAAGFYLADTWSAFAEYEPLKNALPLFTVLTISATGTEMNPNAVITNAANKQKWALVDPRLFPVTSIIDPAVQRSLPWRQTVNGCVDAMSHIHEFFFLGTAAEDGITRLDESLLATLIAATDALQKDEAAYASRANLAWAATMALNGVAGMALKGGDWSTHGLEHSISAYHPKVAHAEGLAVIFPAWITFQQSENPAQFTRWAQAVWDAATVEEAVAKMKAKHRQWGAPVTLGDLGVGEDEIPVLAANATQRGPLGQLRKIGEPEAKEIFRLAL
ncbi:MAG: iron-containing alcohol dehydrogenase [Candidatus Lernaella stagnicola]|nr:iron-containing alcohol dehydrogenase [Candidatus Lernaella stagnicola]